MRLCKRAGDQEYAKRANAHGQQAAHPADGHIMLAAGLGPDAARSPFPYRLFRHVRKISVSGQPRRSSKARCGRKIENRPAPEPSALPAQAGAANTPITLCRWRTSEAAYSFCASLSTGAPQSDDCCCLESSTPIVFTHKIFQTMPVRIGPHQTRGDFWCRKTGVAHDFKISMNGGEVETARNDKSSRAPDQPAPLFRFGAAKITAIGKAQPDCSSPPPSEICTRHKRSRPGSRPIVSVSTATGPWREHISGKIFLMQVKQPSIPSFFLQPFCRAAPLPDNGGKTQSPKPLAA